MITENDVRLLRRFLVARLYDNQAAMYTLIEYFTTRSFKSIFPSEQSPQSRRKYLARLNPADAERAETLGCILLPEFEDVVFLNSAWQNPRSLYVRLVEPIPELGELGKVYWSPAGDAAAFGCRLPEPAQEGIDLATELIQSGWPQRFAAWLRRLIPWVKHALSLSGRGEG
jgi:hypothetical protein